MFSLSFKKISLLFLVLAFFSSFFVSMQGVEEKESSNSPLDSQKIRICLAMIVKNEAKIIERCLESVKGFVDCVSICDTGSTDDTIEIIEEYCKKNQIPAIVHTHEWQNFGINRTLSIEAARNTIAKFGFDSTYTYFLLLDADMRLVIEKDFSLNQLKADMIDLTQVNSNLSYINTRLLRASLPWKCIGVTHEYWSCRIQCSEEKLNSLWIDDLDDGGSKGNKYERDVALLTRSLAKEPDNERYMFYLAQTYKCLKQFDESIRWYKARIKKEGWSEEVWYSKFMIGSIYEEMGYWELALHWYLDAFEYSPHRAESLHKISRHYRLNGDTDLAYFFAKQGSSIPYPKDSLLFVSKDVYEYQFLEDLSIAAFYTPYKEEGLKAADELILKKDIPYHVKEQAKSNILFYVSNLQIDSILPIEFELPLLRPGSSQYFHPTNPSIKRVANGYDVICRTVNYTHDGGGSNYRSRDDLDPIIRTKNFLLHYDFNFNLLSQKEIVDLLPKIKQSSVQGLEDCRLIAVDHKDWFFATTYDTHPGNVGQCLCKLGSKASNDKLFVEKLYPLHGPDPNRCEKNWLPFVKDGELLAIYGYHPYTIYRIDHENGRCETALQLDLTLDFSHFRGSAPPIEFDEGYLMLIHEVAFIPQRKYLHRFVYLDRNLNIEQITKPFTFLHQGIEYCCGMTIDPVKKNAILSISFEDQKAYLITVNLDQIRMMLEPI